MKRYRKNQKTFPKNFFFKYKIIVPDEKTRKEVKGIISLGFPFEILIWMISFIGKLLIIYFATGTGVKNCPDSCFNPVVKRSSKKSPRYWCFLL